MPVATHTLTFPVHPAEILIPPAPDWHRQWRFESDTFTHILGPRQGILRIQLNHDAGTVTVDYDPQRF